MASLSHQLSGASVLRQPAPAPSAHVVQLQDVHAHPGTVTPTPAIPTPAPVHRNPWPRPQSPVPLPACQHSAAAGGLPCPRAITPRALSTPLASAAPAPSPAPALHRSRPAAPAALPCNQYIPAVAGVCPRSARPGCAYLASSTSGCMEPELLALSGLSLRRPTRWPGASSRLLLRLVPRLGMRE
jgi:hypothetical protein